MKSTKSKLIIAVWFLLLTAGMLQAQNPRVYQNNQMAIGGYDAVAYFTESRAVPGKKGFSFLWEDAEWHFASQENLEKFKAAPEKFMPQFGGYCAYAVANGYTAQSDPLSWKIVNSMLYLNYNKEVQKIWEEKEEEFIIKARQNWPLVLSK